MQKQIIAFIFLHVFINIGFSQASGDYRTINNGSWGILSIWQIYDGISWNPATIEPSYLSNGINIYHNVTVAGDTIDQVIVHPNAVLSYTSPSSVIHDGIGTDLIVNGTLNGAHVDNQGQIEINGKLILKPSGIFRGSGSTIVNGITIIEGTIVNSGPFVNTSITMNDTVNFEAKEFRSHPSYPTGNVIVNGYFNWNNGGVIQDLNLTINQSFIKNGILGGSINGGNFVMNGSQISVQEGTLNIAPLNYWDYPGNINLSGGTSLFVVCPATFSGDINVDNNAVLRLQNNNKIFSSSSNITLNGTLNIRDSTLINCNIIGNGTISVDGNLIEVIISSTASIQVDHIIVEDGKLDSHTDTLVLKILKLGGVGAPNYYSRIEGNSHFIVNDLLELKIHGRYYGTGGISSNGNVIFGGAQNYGTIVFNNLENDTLTGNLTNAINANITFNSNVTIDDISFNGSSGNVIVNGDIKFIKENSLFQTKNMNITGNFIVDLDSAKVLTFGGTDGIHNFGDTMIINNGSFLLQKNLSIDKLKINQSGIIEMICSKNLNFIGLNLINNGLIEDSGSCSSNSTGFVLLNNELDQYLMGIGILNRLKVDKTVGSLTIDEEQKINFSKYVKGNIIIE